MFLFESFLALLLSLNVQAPPPGMSETRDEQIVRLTEIEAAAHDVANGSKSDEALVLAVAFHESGFALDIDKGPCRADTCDHGLAACMMQIHATPEHRKELFADRKVCFAEGLKYLKMSLSMCGYGPDGFAIYASGSCTNEGGKKGSRELFYLWQTFLQRVR